ncbi:MAG: exodeoxyribonuclease III [Eudoraea sp.]|nr:exodeoxyribonuclease III [Eudoraea sp.]
MKILSYNVNGIRAAMNKGLVSWLKASDPDVICLQEIKAMEDQIDTQALASLGYKHQHWFSAEKKGYSGVAILSKLKPDKVTYGTGISYMDKEGRNLQADFNGLSVLSVYVPSGSNLDRLDLKLQYMADFKDYVIGLKKSTPNLVVCGDYNVCHQAIDIHDPVRNKNVSGFLPVERQWMTDFLSSGFIDSFRHLNPEPHNYTWWSYRANSRSNNKGWRLDYAIVSDPLASRLQRSVILSEAVHSDHCPVLVEID